MKKPDLDYGTLFSRNLGVLTEAQQDRIRAARVLILGDMGSGETLCTLLVRCGFEGIGLAGEGRYAPGTAPPLSRQMPVVSPDAAAA